MNTDDRYERYGLGGNPFQRLSTQRLARISHSHANLSVDEQLAAIKAEVFHRKQKAFVTLVGRQGFGKTERILVASKEAEKNKLFHVVFSAKPSMQSAMEGLLQKLAPKGSTLLSNDKWEREIAGLKKKVKKGYDPTTVGNTIANALNMNVPCFLLLDDLHYMVRSSDSDLFFQTLNVVMQKCIPGVFILATVDETMAIPQPIINLVQSMQTDSFHLNQLSYSDAEQVLSKHLESYRLVSGISSTYPFTCDAVEWLNETARGNPLLLLSCANVALVAAAMQKTISITKDIVMNAFGVIQNQLWYEDLSSLVLDRSVQLPVMLPPKPLKRKGSAELSIENNDSDNLKAESEIEQNIDTNSSIDQSEQGSNLSKETERSLQQKSSEKDERLNAEPEVSPAKQSVPNQNNADLSEKQKNGFDKSEVKSKDSSTDSLKKNEIDKKGKTSSYKEPKEPAYKDSNPTNGQEGSMESDEWEPVEESIEHPKSSESTDSINQAESANFVEEQNISSNQTKNKNESELKKSSQQPIKDETIEEDKAEEKKNQGEEKKIQKQTEEQDFSDSINETEQRSVSKEQYSSYQPELGIVNIGPTPSTNPHPQNQNESQYTPSHQQQKPENVPNQVSSEPVDDDNHSKNQKNQHGKDSVSKMKQATNEVEQLNGEQSLQKSNKSDEQVSKMKESKKPSVNLPTMKGSNQSEEKNIRIVKVKCPECNQIFTTELTEDKKELHCPFCGFTGGY